MIPREFKKLLRDRERVPDTLLEETFPASVLPFRNSRAYSSIISLIVGRLAPSVVTLINGPKINRVEGSPGSRLKAGRGVAEGDPAQLTRPRDLPRPLPHSPFELRML